MFFDYNKKCFGFVLVFLSLCFVGFWGCAGISGYGVDALNLVYPEGKSDTEIWPEKSLKGEFVRYWALRFDGETEKIFKMEAPYIQKIINFDKYHRYMRGAKTVELVKMEIMNIEKIHDYLYNLKFKTHIIPFLSTDKESIKEVYVEEKWVKSGGKWHHVLHDRLQFSELS